MRLQAVYGAEFTRHYPDVESVTRAKREWAKDIGQYSRERIDKMFAYVRSEMARGSDEYRWLSIGNILSILGASWQHAMQSRPVDSVLGRDRPALENLTAREQRKEKNKQRMAAMRAELGI